MLSRDKDPSPDQLRNGSSDVEQILDDPEAYDEGDIHRTLVRIRSAYHDWTYAHEWGPEMHWSEAFNDDLEHAASVGPRKRSQLLRSFDTHCTRGRDMLEELKRVGFMSRDVRRDPMLVKDTFLQAYDLMTCILSEVKFVEIRIDDHRL